MTTSVNRVSKLDLAAILQQQNPTIDLRIDAYEESTRNFRNAVASYTQRAMAEITRRKNEYTTRKSKIAERTKQVENETNACKVRELELMKGTSNSIIEANGHELLIIAAVLEREQEERKELESSVATFRRQLASIKEKCASLDVEIEQRRAVVQNLQRGLHRNLHTSYHLIRINSYSLQSGIGSGRYWTPMLPSHPPSWRNASDDCNASLKASTRTKFLFDSLTLTHTIQAGNSAL